MSEKERFSEHLSKVGHAEGEPVPVNLSRSLAPLLSEQLYRSPLKAIEELVVNAYDADALECRLFVPAPSNQDHQYILVYDNGIGMDNQGLRDLWQIGRSPKTDIRQELTKRDRKQIGKFGIGKLAAYAIAHQLTYVTKKDGEIRSVSINFRAFKNGSSNADGSTKGVNLPVHRLDDPTALKSSPRLSKAMREAGVSFDVLDNEDSWTIAFLEDFKTEKAKKLRLGYLKRVLSTAMPLRNDFTLYLNDEEIQSAKEDYKKAAEFTLLAFAKEKLDDLRDSTGEDWRIEDDAIVSSSFPSGITGNVFITAEKTLTTGKSADLFRSHGFFIRVRGRLINKEDPLFGMNPQSHKYFNRFRADIEADDLDQVLTAPREGVEDSDLEDLLQRLIRSVFYYARSLRDKWEEEQEKGAVTQTEEHRNYISPALVEYPIADVLVSQPADEPQSDADHDWFYLDLSDVEDRDAMISALYKEKIDSDEARRQYTYKYAEMSESRRLVRFKPESSLFVINDKHEFVREHKEGTSSPLLEDIVTAEALLEIYMRENGVSAGVVGEVLERRDTLLRSLALDRPYSLKSLSEELRDAAANQYDLEIALVSAARRLGFIAKQISGPGKPDGIARFNDYDLSFKKGPEVRIILEAKSSGKTPQLGALDFAGLFEHKVRDWSDEDDRKWKEFKGESDGCLLVAPSYPGVTKGDESAVAWRAEKLGISCWTIDQLADFVAAAERKHLTARDLLGIVLNHFTPDAVSAALEKLLNDKEHIGEEVYRAVIEELRSLEGKVPGKVRTLDFIHRGLIDKLTELTEEKLKKAVSELASASRGGLVLRDNGTIVLNNSVEEIERRVADLLKRPGPPRRSGTFRSDD